MRLRVIIILFSILTFSIKAQHAYFASLNQNLLVINPAFVGTNGKLRIQLMNGITGFPMYSNNKKSYYAGVDFLGKKYSGFGLSFSSDTYGPVLRRTQADFTYGLHFTVRDKIKIVSALQMSYFEYKFDQTKLTSGDWSKIPTDIWRDDWGTLTPTVYYKRNVDFSAGLLAYGKRFYAGASFLSLTEPDEGFAGVSKRPLTQIYQGKYKLLDPEKLNLDVYGFLKIQKYNKYIRAENFIQYGAYLNYKVISLHLAQRINEVSDYDELIAGVALNIKGFRVGYNNKCNYGSHLSTYFFNEFYLQYCFGKKNVEGEPNTSIKLIN